MEGRNRQPAKPSNENDTIKLDKLETPNPAAEKSTVHEALMLSTWLADDANFTNIDKNQNGFVSETDGKCVFINSTAQ